MSEPIGLKDLEEHVQGMKVRSEEARRESEDADLRRKTIDSERWKLESLYDKLKAQQQAGQS